MVAGKLVTQHVDPEPISGLAQALQVRPAIPLELQQVFPAMASVCDVIAARLRLISRSASHLKPLRRIDTPPRRP